MIKTKRKTLLLAAISALLAAAFAAVALAMPMRARTAVADDANAEQDGEYWYSTESPYEVEFGDRLYRRVLDYKTKDATNDAVTAEQTDAECYTEMIELEKLNLEGSTNKWKRIYDHSSNGAYLVAPHFGEIKLTFSFKFDAESKEWFYIANGISTEDVGSDKWQYMLHIGKDGTVAFGCGLADGEDYTTEGIDGKFATIDNGSKKAFTDGKVYQVEYIVQRLFNSVDDVASDGNAVGMRQSVKITSRDVAGTDIEFAHNFTNDVTYCKTSHKLRIGMQENGTGISLASYYYSEDYALQGEVTELDMDDAIPTLGPDGISSFGKGGTTLDGTKFTALQKSASAIGEDMRLMKEGRALLFRVDEINDKHSILINDIASAGRKIQINSGTGGVLFVFSIATDRNDGNTSAWQENITAPALFNNSNNNRPNNLIVKLLYTKYKSSELDREFTKLEFALYDGSSITQQSQLATATPWIRRTAFYPDSVTLGNAFTIRCGGADKSGTPGGEDERPTAAEGDNMTISAVEFDREYEVTLKANATDTAATAQTIKYGTEYNFTEPDKSKWEEYYTFGNYESEDGNLKFGSSGTALTSTWGDDIINNITYDPYYDVTEHKYKVELVAGYTPIDYTVTFNPGDHATMPSGKEGPITLKKNGATYDLEQYDPTVNDESYKFFGWYTDADCTAGNEVTALDLSLVPAGKKNEACIITLYAKVEQGITVTLEYPDGSTQDVPTYANQTFTFPTEFPAGKGFGYGAITGWQLKTGEGTYADATTEATITLGEVDVTYRAVSEPETYTITYELDGGNNSADNPANYTVNTPDITFKAADKEGYFFDGWYDAANKRVKGITSGSMAENITLTAKYFQNTLPDTITAAVNVSCNLPVPTVPNDSDMTLKVKDADETVIYEWPVPDDDGAPAAWTFTQAGTYTVEYEIVTEYKTYNHTITVTVNAKPAITVTGSYASSYVAGTVLTLLEATVNVDGATVAVSVAKDDVPVVVEDNKVTLEAGTYTVTYTADGADPVVRTFTVTAAPAAGKSGCGGGCNSKNIPLLGTLIALLGSAVLIKRH